NPKGGATLGARTTAQLKILDNETTAQFSAAAYTVAEGAAATITVERTGPTGFPGTVVVQYATSDGTGVAGTDYIGQTGTLTFGPGVTVQGLTIQILPNTRDDGDRTFSVALSAPTGGATLGSGSTATVIITDDDVGGSIQFSVPTFSATECA